MQFGKYQLLRRLARGGMGEVFLARLVGELGFEKQLVIKTILPEFATKPQFIDLFAREAKTAVALSHGNIVPTYELGRVDDTFYIVMGYVDGPSVEQLLASWRKRGVEPPLPVALHIVRSVLTGLAYAHRQEHGREAVVHRDISPRNVLIDRSGQVRIVDFGIATRAKAQVRLRAGSTGYMAPEQARGELADPRADVFSTACLLFVLLTGTKAFPNEGVWSEPDLNALPESLREPMAKALCLDPSERPADATAFLRALRPALAEHAATFGDLELANHLAESFGPDWHPGSEPIAPGDTKLVGNTGQTFATRLTAITGVVPEDEAMAANGAAVDEPVIDGASVDDMAGVSLGQADVASPLERGASGPIAAQEPPPARRRSVFSVAAVLVALGAFGLGQALATAPAHNLRTWTSVAPVAVRAPVAVAAPESEAPSPGASPPATTDPEQSPSAASESPKAPNAPPDGESVLRASASPRSPESETKIASKASGKVTKPAKGEGFLLVRAPSVTWAEVRVDGERAGHTPTRKLTLPAGRHRIDVECTDACPSPAMLLQRTITIEDGQTEVLRAP